MGPLVTVKLVLQHCPKDFNGDGLSDVIIAAPTFGIRDVSYDGAVHVFINDNWTRTTTTTPLPPSVDADVTFKPPKTTSSRSSTFGWSLESIK